MPQLYAFTVCRQGDFLHHARDSGIGGVLVTRRPRAQPEKFRYPCTEVWFLQVFTEEVVRVEGEKKLLTGNA